MVQTSTEGNYNSDWLLYEETDIGRYSRDNVVIGASQNISVGQPLEWADAGKTNAVALAGTAAANGFAGIATEAVVTGVGESKEIAVVSRHARVAFGKLQFPVGATTPDKDFAKTLLAAAGILTVDEA